MKEDPEGQYVTYHEHQDALDAMRYENDNLWERIAQQAREHKLLSKDRQEWIDRHKKLWEENLDLKIGIDTLKIITVLLGMLFLSAFVFIGVLTWH